MKSSEIEIKEGGPYDGRIMAVQHHGEWPEVFYMPRLRKYTIYHNKNFNPLDPVDFENIRYINSGKTHNGRWIFIRDETCTRS